MSQNRGKTVRKRVLLLMSVALSWLMLATLTAAGPASAGPAKTARFDAKRYLQTHGYLPLRGVATLERAKANAAAIAAAIQPAANLATAATLRTPTIGAHWPGVATSNVSPPDANGAIGPNSYVEVVNQKMGIYTRAGSKLAGASLTTLSGHSGESDPMVLWDPHTQRFYYNVLNVNNAKMDWGYSKTANPTSIPGSFCNYETSFNYSTSSIPDYPKLGQTKDFLMIGVNFYAGASSSQTTSSDILWVKKPQGTGAVTTCPSATSFGTGKITGLLNEDGTQAFTPTPAIQTDPSSTGYIMSMSDIECPPNCGTGTKLTVFTLTPNGSNPSVPQISAPDSITVGSYTNPANAPQKNSVNTLDTLDTLDGRITHAVSGFDPVANATTVWVAHAVLGGAGAQVRWYEIKPTPQGSGTVVQSGSATSSSLYSFNAGIQRPGVHGDIVLTRRFDGGGVHHIVLEHLPGHPDGVEGRDERTVRVRAGQAVRGRGQRVHMQPVPVGRLRRGHTGPGRQRHGRPRRGMADQPVDERRRHLQQRRQDVQLGGQAVVR